METNPKTISVTDLRMTTREILDAAHFKGQHYVVERNGKPMVVVVGVEEYERMVALEHAAGGNTDPMIISEGQGLSWPRNKTN